MQNPWNFKTCFSPRSCKLKATSSFVFKMSLKAHVFVVAVLIFVLLENILCFKIQFFGKYVSDDDYAKRKLCNTNICLLDTDRLISSATQNSSVHPCNDFKEFTMGEFYKHRVLNDRYSYIGFQLYTQHLFKERQRIVLNKSFAENEPKTFKVLKSFFSKCTNSGF